MTNNNTPAIFSSLVTSFGGRNAALIMSGKIDLKYDVFSDPSGRYHADGVGYLGSSSYVGSRYEWVATFESPEEAYEYARQLNGESN